MKNKNTTYLVLTIILTILSAIGGYFLYNLYQQRSLSTYTSTTVPKIELIPTDTIPQPSPFVTQAPTSTIIETDPVATITATVTPKPSSLTPTTSLIPTTTSNNPQGLTLYQNKQDSFSLSYRNHRQFYQDTEASGNRYTFTNSQGNFAIHVSSKDKWSWTHPDRQFTGDLLVSGKNTFKYEIESQTIIDLQSTDKNYTIQCIHNGLEALKLECQQFTSSFKLL